MNGSSYRSAGARVLITDNGRWIGCLKKGTQRDDYGQAVTITYDTREESNHRLGIGLGCNGVIDVLIEPAATNDPQGIVNVFQKLVTANKPVLIGTVFNGPSSIGSKLVMDADGRMISSLPDPAFNQRERSDLKRLAETRKTESKWYKPFTG